jgi:hypothetical protein
MATYAALSQPQRDLYVSPHISTGKEAENRDLKHLVLRVAGIFLGAGLIVGAAFLLQYANFSWTSLLSGDFKDFSMDLIGIGAGGSVAGIYLLAYSIFKKTKYQKFAALKLEANEFFRVNKTEEFNVERGTAAHKQLISRAKELVTCTIPSMQKFVGTQQKALALDPLKHEETPAGQRDVLLALVKKEITDLEAQFEASDPINYCLMKKIYASKCPPENNFPSFTSEIYIDSYE